ncbi:MAG: PPC domain-containing DNA-binding protein [Elusimicrobiota bacterium]
MRFKKEGSRYFVRLERGEQVLDALAGFALEEGVASASFSGIGAVEEPTLGYYDLPKRAYMKKEFSGEYEVAGLLGNICELDGKPMVHAHAILADAQCRTFGGHLFAARVSLTLEVSVQSFSFKMRREPDAETGLKLISM